MSNQREGYVPETHLGQIKIDGKWMDYARGHREESIRWAKGDPDNRRVVDWIRKEQIIWPEPVLDTSDTPVEFVLHTDGPDITVSLQGGCVYIHDGVGSVTEIDDDHFTTVMTEVIRQIKEQ